MKYKTATGICMIATSRSAHQDQCPVVLGAVHTLNKRQSLLQVVYTIKWPRERMGERKHH